MPNPNVVVQAGSWENYGKNLHVQKVQRLVSARASYTDWKRALGDLEEVVKTHTPAEGRMRPAGSTWSFSPCAVTTDTIVSTASLPGSVPVPQLEAKHLHAGGSPDGLIHVSAGATVRGLNALLETRDARFPMGRALYTQGGNCGQTLGGALATGTHGSFWQRKSIGDSVAALTLVTPTGTYWLESNAPPKADAPCRLTADGFDGFGRFKVIRDDALFRAALVSVGTFGFVFSVVMRVREPKFLGSTRKTFPFDASFRQELVSAFKTATAPKLGRLRVDPPALRPGDSPWGAVPEHVEVVLEPYANKAFVTNVYEAPWTSQVGDPLKPGFDNAFLEKLVSGLAYAEPDLIPTVMAPLMALLYPDQQHRGPFSTTYPLSELKSLASLSMEVAIPYPQLDTTLTAIFKVLDHWRTGNGLVPVYLPGVIGIRFMRPSHATLAPTRFEPLTCTLEFACLGGSLENSKAEVFLKKTTVLLDHIVTELKATRDAAGRPVTFALHWGQYFDPASVSIPDSYGSKSVAAWKAARDSLVGRSDATFGNDFTQALGLTP